MPRPPSWSPGFSPGFGVGKYWYSIGPYVWKTTPRAGWYPPELCVGSVDLRSLPHMTASETPQGNGFFVTAKPPGPGYDVIAIAFHFGEEQATTQMRNTWFARLGHNPAGDTVADLLWDQLTNGSDPTGQAGPLPLMPKADGNLELAVSGHSVVRREVFRWGNHPHTNRVRDVVRKDFRANFLRNPTHARRVLDKWREKYRTGSWQEFIPADLLAVVPGPLPHQTTITDDFTRADGDTIGNLLTWTEITGDIDTVSNAAKSVTASDNIARAESDLSGDDHYSQGVVTFNTAGGPGLTVRHHASAVTHYTMYSEPAGSYWEIFKYVGGSYTQLGTGNSGWANPSGATYRLSADGSSVEAFVGGVSKVGPVTDSAITGNLRCGMYLFKQDNILDNFEAADIAAGRTTRNTRSHPLGVRVGVNWRVTGPGALTG